jgi:hypothetical protein
VRIRLAFGYWDGDVESAALIAAVDEYTEDTHNGIPDFYSKVLSDHRHSNGTNSVRECFITVPDSEVMALFAIPTVKSSSPAPTGREEA